jgi:hypothetical protein
METIEKKVASKQRILQEARVCCEPHYTVTRYCRDEEARAKALESWCKDFNDFIRDHRHQDGTHLSVDRVMADVCSACKADWETYAGEEPADIGKTFCASCGTEVAA